jgi:hypothetical protein
MARIYENSCKLKQCYNKIHGGRSTRGVEYGSAFTVLALAK